MCSLKCGEFAQGRRGRARCAEFKDFFVVVVLREPAIDVEAGDIGCPSAERRSGSSGGMRRDGFDVAVFPKWWICC